MSSAHGSRTDSANPRTPGFAGRNKTAKAAGVLALGAVGALGNFVTGLAWLNPEIFLGLAVLCAVCAIPVGHVARFRARRFDGEGRGVALLAILTGWAALLVSALAILAFLGLLVGLVFLTGKA